jgi:hypothetical protein
LLGVLVEKLVEKIAIFDQNRIYSKFLYELKNSKPVIFCALMSGFIYKKPLFELAIAEL